MRKRLYLAFSGSQLVAFLENNPFMSSEASLQSTQLRLDSLLFSMKLLFRFLCSFELSANILIGGRQYLIRRRGFAIGRREIIISRNQLIIFILQTST